ncbi:TIGR01440 family protein [Salibacterium salarium]|uniref:UPF0340 protein D7Z54_18560 n=1 Tax=Salibacterium salarium TaxID=284579 RepID=A0A428N047_9BACI|nr:TIGR01440 family protein [Salibacterium salarium]RSL31803.1 TIGR01440 family protein [Salibacterium salarium]
MNHLVEQWQASLQNCLNTLQQQTTLNQKKLFVVGASTSEVVGKDIGSAGSDEAAKALYEIIHSFQQNTGIHLAFQGCEHINRALVVERVTAETFNLEEVTAVPHRKAGGAMATHAYSSFTDPVVVEHLKADAGIDIGDTFIGMHLKHVAVPIRAEITSIGKAHVTMAKTRPKLIGGTRAKYTDEHTKT